MSVLDYRLLRQFLAVAELGSVRAAAQRLHMSQPPLTQALRQLESRLGCDLFRRSARGMALTAAGMALAEEARGILAALDRAERRVKAVTGRSEPLRVGFVSAALNEALPALLRGLSGAGLVQPTLYEMGTPQQIEALSRAEIDLGFLHPPAPMQADMTSLALGRDPFLAAVPAGHKLARKRSLRLRDIASEPLVLFPETQGPVLYGRIREAVTKIAGDLHIAAEAARVHSQLAIVAGGSGIGFVTASTARSLTFKGVKTMPVEDTAGWFYLELELRGHRRVMEEIAPLLRGAITRHPARAQAGAVLLR